MGVISPCVGITFSRQYASSYRRDFYIGRNECVRKYNEKCLASFLIQGISGIVRANRKVHNLSEEYSSSCVPIVSKVVKCVKTGGIFILRIEIDVLLGFKSNYLKKLSKFNSYRYARWPLCTII